MNILIIMNLNIKKVIGHGLMGTAYLSEINGIKCVTKIEKYEEVKTPLLSAYYRQLEFDKIASKYPDKFLTLVHHGILKKCDHQQKLPDDGKFPKSLLKHLKEKNKLEDCYILSYTPVLDGTLNEILMGLSRNEWINCLAQLVDSVNIMKQNGFYHRDLHGGNIMYKKNGSKYQWFIIDYGLIYKKNYPTNYDDKIIMNMPKNLLDTTDITSLLWTIIKNPTIDYMVKHKIQFPPYDKFLKYIKNDKQFDQILQMIKKIPNVKKKSKYYYVDVITLIFFNELWIRAIGLDINKHSKLIYQQECPEIIFYMLGHIHDKDYGKVVKYLKSKI